MKLLAEYVAVVLLHKASQGRDEAFGGSVERIREQLSNEIGSHLGSEEVDIAVRFLEPFGAAESDFSPLTGGFWHIDYDNFRYYFIESKPDDEDDTIIYEELSEKTNQYPVLQAYARRGSRYAEDAIEHLRNLDMAAWADLRTPDNDRVEGLVPASDRVVRLDHNQQDQIDEPLGAIIEGVEAENSIAGEDGLREFVLGKVRAGRELIRAGIFSLESLQLTLIIGLKMLAEKYGELAIGVAASKLLDLLLAQYGIS